MNKKTLLILCAVLVVVLLGAGVLYNSLSDRVQLGGLVVNPPATEASTTEGATEGTAESTQQTTVTEETTAPTEAPDNAAPDFTMQNWEGEDVNLSDFLGKPIILNFWASWCGPCKLEMPDLEEAYQKYGERIHFLMVNCVGGRETVESAKEFIESAGYTFPVYFDTTSLGAYTYGANSIPLTYFIDAEGNLQAYYMGAMSASILQQGIELIYTEE